MDEDWRNAFGILMCTEICYGAGTGICNGVPSTCSSIDWKASFFIGRIMTKGLLPFPQSALSVTCFALMNVFHEN